MVHPTLHNQTGRHGTPKLSPPRTPILTKGISFFHSSFGVRNELLDKLEMKYYHMLR